MQCWGFVNNILNATEIPASSWDQVAVGTLSVSTSTHIVHYSHIVKDKGRIVSDLTMPSP